MSNQTVWLCECRSQGQVTTYVYDNEESALADGCTAAIEDMQEFASNCMSDIVGREKVRWDKQYNEVMEADEREDHRECLRLHNKLMYYWADPEDVFVVEVYARNVYSHQVIIRI